MIEPTGYTALDLVGYTDKGTYAANVNYVKNDLVHYGGSIWRILIDDTIGITPAEGPNYTLFIGEPTNLVERIIAPLEDNPATVAYQTGRQIIYNDYLYEVIQNIAVGDILIAYEDDPTNANIKLASPVETQVLALKADKINKSDIANNVTTTVEGKVLDARQGKALQDSKTDTSVIAPVESGTTASRAYAIGAHFIRDGAFCTAKTAIAQGETFTLNTNYTAGTVGNSINDLIITPEIITTNPGSGSSNATIERCSRIKFGKLVNISARIKIMNDYTDAMNVALLALDIRPRADMDNKFPPSFIKVNNTPWTNLVRIKKFSNNMFYAEQNVVSSLKANDMVEMYFSYIAE